jgi:hypothetical protein
MSICKNKPKTPISGRLAGVPVESSALPAPNFHPIRRDLSPDLAMGGANGWRCSYLQHDFTLASQNLKFLHPTGTVWKSNLFIT